MFQIANRYQILHTIKNILIFTLSRETGTKIERERNLEPYSSTVSKIQKAKYIDERVIGTNNKERKRGSEKESERAK